ncbi:hypothetical protein PHET_06614 [Paragonimus heterotremus]|uniref:Transmembrane protein n=1 Tax=Paragonimus heterotremus TaxID=100268 RepID=A0A8J4WZ69_9TREM|nr:hypothetical protein PHET_06614 [Paragonimus heterotremus]
MCRFFIPRACVSELDVLVHPVIPLINPTLMNRVTSFLWNHSQKLAFGSVGIAIGTTYFFQPHFEMLSRWALVQTDGISEVKPSDRLERLLTEVSRNFVLNEKIKCDLDLFLTKSDHVFSVGSVRSAGYAFIGLPRFASYSDPSEISTEDFGFYTRHFPYGPYSPVGKQRLALMILPDDALRFVLARELVRLGAKSRDGTSIAVSARTKAMFTVAGMVGGLYAAYQVASPISVTVGVFILKVSTHLFQCAYRLNRVYKLPTHWLLSSRLLLYTGLALFGLFCQWQIALAWRRYNCLAVDKLVAHLDDSFLRGGLAYYDWRIRWNQFWYDRSVEKHTNEQKSHFDPVKLYQEEQQRVEESTETEEQPVGNIGKFVLHDKESGYYLPRIDGTKDPLGPPVDSLQTQFRSSGAFHYKINPRVSACGRERWAGDGDGVGFGLTEMLMSGLAPTWLVWLLGLFVCPATSYLRYSRLAASTADHHERPTQLEKSL